MAGHGVGVPLSAGSSVAGRMKWKVAPWPGADSAQMRPPWRASTRRTLARPMPVPANSRRRVQALEHAEQLAGVGHVEAGAVVAHAERDGCRRRRRRGSTSITAGSLRAAVLDRVAEQVQPHLPQHVVVGHQHRQRPICHWMTCCGCRRGRWRRASSACPGPSTACRPPAGAARCGRGANTPAGRRSASTCACAEPHDHVEVMPALVVDAVAEVPAAACRRSRRCGAAARAGRARPNS